MIVDNIKNANLYFGVNARVKKALEFLQTSDFDTMKPGKYEIDGDKVYAFVQEYETRRLDDCNWEAHRKYMDIQYVAKGIEQIGYAYINHLTVKKAYDPEDDYLLLDGNGNMIMCDEGTFIMFDKDDAHMPGVAVDKQQPVKKVVVKILL